MANKETAKQWFKTGAYPSSAQFAQLFDWLRWGDEELSLEDVQHLQDNLNDLQLKLNAAIPSALIFGGTVTVDIDDGETLRVKYPATKYKLKSGIYTIPAGTIDLSLRPIDGEKSRIDVFYLDKTGLKVVEGTEDTIPFRPSVPAGAFEIGFMKIGNSGTIESTDPPELPFVSYPSRADFPPFGKTNRLYFSKSGKAAYYWNEETEDYENVTDSMPEGGTEGDVLQKDDEGNPKWAPSPGGSFKQSGVGAVTRPAQNKMRDFVSILDFIPESEHENIRNFTSTYDCLAAFNAAKSSITRISGVYKSAVKIVIPFGRYYFSDSLIFHETVCIEGQNTGMTGQDSTVLQFAKDKSGLVFEAYNTDNLGQPAETNSFQSAGSIIRNLSITSKTNYNGIGHGIFTKQRIIIDTVKVSGFGENGVHIHATNPLGNANCFFASKVTIDNCGGHGWYVDGADANAGYASMINVTYCGGCGIYDSSFLGNNYDGCHVSDVGRKAMVSYNSSRYYCVDPTQASTVEPGTDDKVWARKSAGGTSSYWKAWTSGGDYSFGFQYYTDDANARSVFTGCYSEGGFVPSNINNPSVIIGGILASPAVGGGNVGSAFTISGDKNGKLTSFYTTTVGGKVAFGASSQLIQFIADGGISNGVGWQFGLNGALDFVYARSTILFRIANGVGGFAAGRSASVASSAIQFKRGLFIGDGDVNSRFVTFSKTLPTSGEYAAKDIIFCSDSTQPFLGWVCTTGGIAGDSAVFEPFGLIGYSVKENLNSPSHKNLVTQKGVADALGAEKKTQVSGLIAAQDTIAIDCSSISDQYVITQSDDISVDFTNLDLNEKREIKILLKTDGVMSFVFNGSIVPKNGNDSLQDGWNEYRVTVWKAHDYNDDTDKVVGYYSVENIPDLPYDPVTPST